MNENEKKELLELSEEMTSCIPQIDAEDKSKVLTMGARRIRELLAENERLADALAAQVAATNGASAYAVQQSHRAEAAEARYKALCEAEPLAFAGPYETVYMANLVEDGGDDIPLIPRPSMEP